MTGKLKTQFQGTPGELFMINSQTSLNLFFFYFSVPVKQEKSPPCSLVQLQQDVTEEKPFECDPSDKSFTQSLDLKGHLKTHLEVPSTDSQARNHECNKCKKNSIALGY